MNKLQILVLKALAYLLKSVILNYCNVAETEELLAEIYQEMYK